LTDRNDLYAKTRIFGQNVLFEGLTISDCIYMGKPIKPPPNSGGSRIVLREFVLGKGIETPKARRGGKLPEYLEMSL